MLIAAFSRHGYLLHDVSGSGKASLIHAIAGKLKLMDLLVDLRRHAHPLMCHVPERCIAILVDHGAAFMWNVARDSDSVDTPGGDKNTEGICENSMGPSPWHIRQSCWML